MIKPSDVARTQSVVLFLAGAAIADVAPLVAWPVLRFAAVKAACANWFERYGL